jgi:hypothetical protein
MYFVLIFLWYDILYISSHCERCGISCFMKANPCPLAPCPTVFMLLNWHCVINQWCLHIGKCCHCWPQLNLFGFTSSFFLMRLWQQFCFKWRMIIEIGFQWTCFSFCLWTFSNVYISRWTSFFINVPTWREEWRTLEALLFQFCIHFIGGRC